jgi:hypothetical protein
LPALIVARHLRACVYAYRYGYLIGALELGFHHTTDRTWMLSSSHEAEWRDDLVPPLVLHYCQTYYIGEWHFYKYDISACTLKMLLLLLRPDY